jgi:hypothetical protein
VSAGVVQVLAFEIYLGAIELTKPIRTIERRRSAHIVSKQARELAVKFGVVNIFIISRTKLADISLKNFGDKSAAEVAIEATVIDRE